MCVAILLYLITIAFSAVFWPLCFWMGAKNNRRCIESFSKCFADTVEKFEQVLKKQDEEILKLHKMLSEMEKK